MKVLGLILELNPFHNGHYYFIKKAIDIVNPDYTVATISTSFSQRGDISVISKFDKTNMLLDSFVDVVIENQIIGYNCSADYFAYNSIKLLNKLKVTDICFGVELDDISTLYQLNEITKNDNYNKLVKYYLDKGYSYSTSTNKAILEFTNDVDLAVEFSKPNNTLAISYIKAIEKINPNINIHLVKRIENNYYDNNLSGKISSATSIRNELMKNNNVDEYTPFKCNYIDINKSLENLYMLFRYKLLSDNISYMLSKEGIENRIREVALTCNDYNSFIETVCTKRYKANMIKRLMINILLELDINTNQIIDTFRILGFNEKGNKLINKLPKDEKKLITTNIKDVKDNVLLTELKLSKLYSIITNNKDLYKEEYKIPIKRRDIK